MNIDRDLVTAAYRLFLEREPENETVIEEALARCQNIRELRQLFLGSTEYAQKSGGGFGSHTDKRSLSIIEEHFSQSPTPIDGFVVNRLGVRTRLSSLWDDVQHLSGKVIPAPIDGDFHGSPYEWVGLLKSVRSATGSFCAMELGAGWGPWAVAGAVAARNMGIREVFLVAVEADPGHFTSLRQHFVDNGLDPDQHRLIQAAVAVNNGRLAWPKVISKNDWGSRPLTLAQAMLAAGGCSISDYLGRQFREFTEIDAVSFTDLLRQRPSWDFVHIDVQGHEAELCQSAIEELSRRVRWLVIGTHSRSIEGCLLKIFMNEQWVMEHETAVHLVFRPGGPTEEALTDRDGTQIWHNTQLPKSFIRARDERSVLSGTMDQSLRTLNTRGST